jgi:hypothetical protein
LAVDRVDWALAATGLVPVVPWLADVEPPSTGSAWATPVAAASEAQKPTVTAPAPSQVEISLRFFWAR